MYRFSVFLLLSWAVLSAQEPDHIYFPHDFHVTEVEIECSTCHENASTSSSVLNESLLPTMETCGYCHEIDDDDNCELCHTNPDEPRPISESRPAYKQDFTHQYHLQKRPDCLTCHSYILDDDGTNPGKLWVLDDCRSCHQQQKPEFHTLAWTKSHGLGMNLASQTRCQVCHTPESCDNCHELQPFNQKVHTGDFIQRHGFEARTGVTDCESCHDIEETCYSCHRQQIIMPLDHNTPNWVNTLQGDGSQNQHGEAAMDTPEICQVCHRADQDGTCLKCHGE